MGQIPDLRGTEAAPLPTPSPGTRGEEEEEEVGDQSILQKGAPSLMYPRKHLVQASAGSLSHRACAGRGGWFLPPFLPPLFSTLMGTWVRYESFRTGCTWLHRLCPILAAMSSHRAAVLSQITASRERLFPATSPAVPPPGV